MTVDLETRLREALHARAAEVVPDTRSWALVQARLRRSRQRRLVLAGMAAAAVVAAASVAVPALLGGSIVRFEPPVADQPGESSLLGGADGDEVVGIPDPVPAQEGEPPGVATVEPCDEPAASAAVWTGGGDVWLACANGSVLALTTTEATDTNPAVSPAGDAVVFQRVEPGEEHPVLVHRELGPGATETVIGGGSVPAFAPDGRLARVLDAGDGTSVIQIGQPFSEPEAEAALPVPAQDVRSLEWDPAGDRLVYTVAAPGDVAVWTYEPGDGRFRTVLPPGEGYLAVAFSPDGAAVAALRLAGDAGVELVAFDRTVLDGGAAGERVIAPGARIVDPSSEGVFVASAGYARLEPAGSGQPLDWRPAGEPSWFVGDGAAFHVVDSSGRAVALGRADGAARNPVAEVSATARELSEALATVQRVRDELAAAAERRDTETLGGLMVGDFNFSFGQGNDREAALAYFEENPELLGRLVSLLEQPSGVVEGTPAIHVWPRAHALDPAEWTAADVEALRSTGATEEEIASWRESGSYLGLRAGIDADGRWRFLVEGD